MGLGAAAMAPTMLAGGGASAMVARGAVGAASPMLAMRRALGDLVSECAELHGELGSLGQLSSPQALVRHLARFMHGVQPSDLRGLSPMDLLSEQGMREFFLAQGGDEHDANWRSSTIFGEGSEWQQCTDLLRMLGGDNCKIPIDQLQKAVGDRGLAMLKPQLQRAFQQDRGGVLRALQQEGTLDAQARAQLTEWCEEGQEEAQAAPLPNHAAAEFTLLRHGHQQGQHRYVLLPNHDDVSLSDIRTHLRTAHPVLAKDAVQWQGNHILAAPGSEADRVLHAMAMHVKEVPTPRVHETQRMNAVLKCAATANELKR